MTGIRKLSEIECLYEVVSIEIRRLIPRLAAISAAMTR